MRQRAGHGTWLAEVFDEHRTCLRAVAYRMLGSLPDADAVLGGAAAVARRAAADGPGPITAEELRFSITRLHFPQREAGGAP